LAYFSFQFGLPFKPEQLQVVYAAGFQPTIDPTGGWELEESLDIEYAHAMAPNATIYLVEAASNLNSDLLTAVAVATNLVQCGLTTTCATITSAGEVSMSWGGGENSNETSYDSTFNKTNVVFFAAAGDSPGTIWPCVSVNVVCVGGTSTTRGYLTGNFQGEYSWTEAGGGASLYETLPSYQSGVGNIAILTDVSGFRGVPDVASDANPNTGVWVYDSYPIGFVGDYSFYGWVIVGGTSVSSPTWAGIVNNAGSFAASTSAELTTMYANRHNTADFNDLVYGYFGPYASFTAVPAWDPCTGIGSPHSTAGK